MVVCPVALSSGLLQATAVNKMNIIDSLFINNNYV